MAKSKFRTVYERIRYNSNPGDPIVLDFGIRKDKNGADLLVVTDKHNIYDEIQAYKDSCDLSKILERFRLTGDPMVLQQKQGFYGDVAEFPKTYAEFLNITLQAKEEFAKLPSDIRDKFNNSVDEFIASIGSEKFDEIYNPSVPDVIEKTESEVKADE